MPAETYRLNIQALATGEQAQNVLYFICDNNDDATPLSIAKELTAKWNATFKALFMQAQSNRYVLRYIKAQRVLPSGGNSWVLEWPEGTEVGSVNAEQASLQVAPIMKLYGGLSDGKQGRTFLPAPPDTSIVENVLDSGYVSDMIDYYDNMLTFSGATHDFLLAIYSRLSGTSTAVSAAGMSQIIGLMRKRCRPM